MDERICCFSGHRQIQPEEYARISDMLYSSIREKVNAGVRVFCAGGALGFDMLAETIVLQLKHIFPEIKLRLVLPCKMQAKSWTAEQKARYERIKEESDEVIYVSEEYFRGCMHKRNRELVDMSDSLICYLKQKNGGTAYTVEYAKKKGLRIINLAKEATKKTE